MQRLAKRGAKNFEFRQRVPLEALDDHQIGRARVSPVFRRATARARRATRERCAQRRLETITTSVAPASRCSHESLPGRSISNAWCACLTVATLMPRRLSSGTTRVISVVLPAPLQPARPITRMDLSRANRGFKFWRNSIAAMIRTIAISATLAAWWKKPSTCGASNARCRRFRPARRSPECSAGRYVVRRVHRSARRPSTSQPWSDRPATSWKKAPRGEARRRSASAKRRRPNEAA